jgi:hypothetical protein
MQNLKFWSVVSKISSDTEQVLQVATSERLHSEHFVSKILKKKNTVALVRNRIILTERPPLVGEVSANLCG